MTQSVPATYQAAVLESPRQIRLREVPLERPGPGEALLRIACAGVCGTDVSIFRGDYPVPLPLILGHEFSARVVEAAPGTPAEALVGRAVVCEINNSCLAYGREEICEACRRGLPTHCLRRTVTGIISHPGAFGQYLRVPAGNVHPIPEELPLDAAVLVEPLAAAIRTFELTEVREGDLVVVLGCGRLGRMVALVAGKARARVVAVGRSEEHLTRIAPYCWHRIRLARGEGEKREAADLNGVRTVRSHDELRAAILDLTGGLGADVVVEATGVNDNLKLAQTLVRPMGTVAMKSTSGVPVNGLDTTRATVDELRFQASRCGPFDKAIEFMRRHGVPNASWITARFPLDRADEAIEAAVREPKVLIEMQ